MLKIESVLKDISLEGCAQVAGSARRAGHSPHPLRSPEAESGGGGGGMKTYIGDGVYVDYDGYMLVLTTEDGVSVTNTIYLEPTVYRGLLNYVGKLEEEAEAKAQVAP